VLSEIGLNQEPGKNDLKDFIGCIRLPQGQAYLQQNACDEIRQRLMTPDQ
jgi:hypothetical protein